MITLRCPVVSFEKMSSSTGSISNAASSSSGVSGAELAIVSTAALGSPSVNAFARAISSLISAVGSVPTSSCSINPGNAAAASSIKSTMGGVRTSVRLIKRFSRFSMLQLYSPIRSAPTIRPLPFSVWNDRRTVMSVSMSSGASCQTGSLRLMDATSSLASSINNSRSSGSRCSMSVATTGNGIISVARTFAARACSSAAASPSSRAMPVVAAAAGAAASSCASRCSTSLSTARQASALSSMYHGSLRPAFTVSM